jgi:hypothetical protein
MAIFVVLYCIECISVRAGLEISGPWVKPYTEGPFTSSYINLLVYIYRIIQKYY